MEALYFLACIASLWQGVTSFVPETAPTAKIAEPGTAKCRHWRVEFSPRFLDTYARLIQDQAKNMLSHCSGKRNEKKVALSLERCCKPEKVCVTSRARASLFMKSDSHCSGNAGQDGRPRLGGTISGY